MKHTLKLSRRSLFRCLGFSLLIAFTLGLLPASATRAQEANNQAAALAGINSLENAKKYIKTSDGKYGPINLKKSGYKAPDDADQRFKTYLTGNPWIEGPEIGGAKAHYALTGYVTISGDSGFGKYSGKDNGVAWIFRNEYQYSLAIILSNYDAGDNGGGPAGTGEDQKALVFSGSCGHGLINHRNDVAKIKQGSGFDDQQMKELLPDKEGDEAFKKVTEGDKRHRVIEKCHHNGGTFGAILKTVMGLVADTVSGLLIWITGLLKNTANLGTLTNNPGLTSAWKTVRDFVNVVFILILCAVAFSNILRIDTDRYGIRALLPRLVFAVLAVNFSFMIVQILANVAYIIGQPFLAKSLQLITHPPADRSLINTEDGDFGQFIIGVIVMGGVCFAMAFLLIFFVIRIVMVWMLAALSPFVFLFMVLPLTRSLSSSWWKSALKWIFMAPVSFVILFIAAEILSGGGDLASVGAKGDVNDANFFLKLAFFIGAAVAAVMIPLKLGGEIMSSAYGGAKSAGKVGGGLTGKLGMSAANKIPTKGGKSLGDRMRTTKAGWDARGELKKGRAQADLAGQIGADTGLGARLAGASPEQQISAFESAVSNAEKEMTPITPMGHMRIANAHKYGTGKGADGKLYANRWEESLNGGRGGVMLSDNNDSRSMGEMDEQEHELSESPVHAAASFKQLSAGEIASPDLVKASADDVNKNFAGTGYQKLNRGDMVMSAYDRSGELNVNGMLSNAHTMPSSDLKKADQGMLTAGVEAARTLQTGGEAAFNNLPEYQRASFHAMRAVDTKRWKLGVSHGDRNSLDVQEKRDAVRDFAQVGGFSRAAPPINGRSTAAAPRAAEREIIQEYNNKHQ